MTQPRDIHPDHSALIVVDMQPDFMPGGALPVAGGDELVKPISDLVQGDRFGHRVATQDWHPPGHISFASQHAGREPFDVIDLYGHEQVLWPDHCVQGSAGAALHADLPLDRFDMFQRKGTRPDVDSYSGFEENWNDAGERLPTGMGGWLRERGVTDVFVCGLARDVCVTWTAEDAVKAGFQSWFLWDLSHSVEPEKDDALRRRLADAGVLLIESADVSG
jgi:nicotinamidase/pyrazinamidase